MEKPSFQHFEDFWPHYVRRHQNKASRMLHLLGAGAAAACCVGGLRKGKRWLWLLAPLAGIGPAWLGHRLFERNEAYLGHVAWSLRAELRMFSMMLAGTMDDEVRRVTQPVQRVGDKPNGQRQAAEENPASSTSNGSRYN